MRTNKEYSNIVAKARQSASVGLNDSELAKALSISRMTLYKRLVDHNWKRHEALMIEEFIKEFKIK